MNIEIKSVKFTKTVGHDLPSIACNIYLDNKKVGTFSDDGWGAGGYIKDLGTAASKSALTLIERWIQDTAPTVYLTKEKHGVDTHFPNSLSLHVSHMVNLYPIQKEAKRLQKRVSILHEGEIFQWPAAHKVTMLNDPDYSLRNEICSMYKGAVFFADMTFDEACDNVRKYW